jgi:hypothetical protein
MSKALCLHHAKPEGQQLARPHLPGRSRRKSSARLPRQGKAWNLNFTNRCSAASVIAAVTFSMNSDPNRFAG